MNKWNVVLDFCKVTNKLRPTCRRPSRVLWMVTHLLGWAPLVVMAVMRESSSSFFSFSFFTRLSMARFEKASLSPPCRWHIRLCTMLRQASLLVGVLVIDILISDSVSVLSLKILLVKFHCIVKPIQAWSWSSEGSTPAEVGTLDVKTKYEKSLWRKCFLG